MKKIVLSFLLLLPVFAVFSQEKVKRSYVGLSLFFPTPTGEYRSTDENAENAAYAKGSVGFGLEGAFMFHPNIGIGGLWAGYANKINTQAFEEDLKKVLQKSYFTGSYDVKASPHSVGVFMVGPNLSLPYKRITLDAKLYVGNLAFKFSKIDMTLKKSSGGTSNLVLEGESTSSLGINPGVAARIRLSKRLGLKLTVDYIYGKPNAKIVTTTKINNVLTSTKTETYSTPVSFVNIGFGLAFQLNKED